MALSGIAAYGSGKGITGLFRKTSDNTEMLRSAYNRLPKALSEDSDKYILSRTDTDSDGGVAVSKRRVEATESLADSIEQVKTAGGDLFRSAYALTDADNMQADELSEKVKRFADDYNSTVSAATGAGSEVRAVRHQMTDITASYSESLKRAGVTADSEGVLSVNDSVLKNNLNDAQKVFGGGYSYSARMAKNASRLMTAAGRMQGGTGIYDRYGEYI